MKLRNFFFAALAATFAFASCDKADSNDGTNGDSAYAGNWFLSVTVDGVEKVAGLKTASYGYIPIEDAVVEGGVINSYVENVYTFAETNGGYTIQDSEGKYLYMGQDKDGKWYNTFQLSTELPESNAVWTIEEQEDGTVKIVNSDQNAYVLQCSTGQYTSFGVYEGVQEGYLLPKLVDAKNATERPAAVYTGDGSEANPYTVADVIQFHKENGDTDTEFWVVGTIAGCYENGKGVTSTYAATNLALKTGDDVIPVQLKSNTSVRASLNLVDNPTNLNKVVKIKGKIQAYFSVAGLKTPSAYSFVE